MATWAQLREALGHKYRLTDDLGSSFKVLFEHPGDRRQAVVVAHYEALNRGWCEVTSAVCQASRLPPTEALTRNFDFAIGALCLDGDVYVVRYTAPVDQLDDQELDWLLQVVAATAYQLEAELA